MTTTLTHKKCGGSVSIDVGDSSKILAPSFSIDITGISKLLLDFIIPVDNIIDPKWWCSKCREQLTAEELDNGVFVSCQVCGKSNACSNTFVHQQLSYVCEKCMRSMMISGKSESGCTRVQIEHAVTFGITEKSIFIPLSKLLLKPFSIG